MLENTHGFCIVIILHTLCQLYTHPKANTLDGNRLFDLKSKRYQCVPTLPYRFVAHTNKASIFLSSKICIYIHVMATAQNGRLRAGDCVNITLAVYVCVKGNS